MVTATWNDSVIAESDDTVVVENNHYFPLDAVAPGTSDPERDDQPLPMERDGELLFGDRGRQDQCRRRVVLCRTQVGSGEHQGAGRVLEGCPRRVSADPTRRAR